MDPLRSNLRSMSAAPEEDERTWSRVTPVSPSRGWRAVLMLPVVLAGAIPSAFIWLFLRRLKHRDEVRAVLERVLAEHGGRDYASWKQLIGQVKAFGRASTGGRRHQVEVQPIWDDRPGGTIRVLFSIDDGGLSAFAPMTNALLLDPP